MIHHVENNEPQILFDSRGLDQDSRVLDQDSRVLDRYTCTRKARRGVQVRVFSICYPILRGTLAGRTQNRHFDVVVGELVEQQDKSSCSW